jgi:hypothetical protein
MEEKYDMIRVERSAEFDLSAPPDEVFPLFGPDRESDWASDWRPEPIYPPEIGAEEGAVFKTSHSGEAIWVMSRYDPALRKIEYTTFRPGDRVGRIRIEVGGRENASHVRVTYAFTALSEQGKQHISHFTEEHYKEMMAHWQRAIEHFLKRGV